MNEELDMEMYMKLRGGCRERPGKVVRLEGALFGVKQVGRR